MTRSTILDGLLQKTRFTAKNEKIYDITHADTETHGASVPTGYPPNTVALKIKATRISGTGNFVLNPTGSGSGYIVIANNGSAVWFISATRLFHYFLSVANDDWDIYCAGLITGEI